MLLPGPMVVRKQRWLPYAVFVTICLCALTFTLTALFLERNSTGADIFELVSVATGLVVAVAGVAVTNVDIFLNRVFTALFTFDFITAVVTIALLLVFGEGFALFGAFFILTMFVEAYCFEGQEINIRLNTGDPNRSSWFKLKVLLMLLALLPPAIFRTSVFFQKTTVSDGYPIGELAGEEITLRDLFEFFLDVIVVRLLVLGLERLRSDRFALVPAYVTMTRLDP